MKKILILHGWGSCAKNWQQVRQRLEKAGCKVFLPDLPGFGENYPLKKTWSVDDYVEWVRDFSEKNNLSQIFLLGHSFGGAIAVKYALKYGKGIKKLFLVSPAIIRKKTFKKETMKKTAKFFSFLPVFLKKIIYKNFLRSDYPLESGAMRETYLKIITQDLLDKVAKITLPTVLIWGEKDDITPFKQSLLIKSKISGAKLITLSGIYHNPHSENPKLLVEKILKNITT